MVLLVLQQQRQHLVELTCQKLEAAAPGEPHLQLIVGRVPGLDIIRFCVDREQTVEFSHTDMTASSGRDPVIARLVGDCCH